MAKAKYGVIYDKDGWRIERHQARAGGEVFSIQRVDGAAEPSLPIAGLKYKVARVTIGDAVEAHFEPAVVK